MAVHLIPLDPVYIESIAKAICRNRIYIESSRELFRMQGTNIADTEILEIVFDNMFETLWGGTSEKDEFKRKQYMEDAVAAISAINLNLLVLN